VTFRSLTLGLLLAAALSGQRIEVYSEFRRIDPFGEIIPMDKGGRPREVLSPLMARNSHSTFHVVTIAPPGKTYYFYATPSSEESLDVSVYKATYVESNQGWAPDGLLRVENPYTSLIPDRSHGIETQRVEMFVVDVWVRKEAKPGRTKLDFQLNMDDHWLIYPMEARITDAVTPDVPVSSLQLPPVEARTDAIILGAVREYVCGIPEPASADTDEPSIRALIRRNVIEDLALARSEEETRGADVVAAGLLGGLNMDRTEFCDLESPENLQNPEWLLRGRDFLYRGTASFY